MILRACPNPPGAFQSSNLIGLVRVYYGWFRVNRTLLGNGTYAHINYWLELSKLYWNIFAFTLINPSTIDDECTHHATLAAFYQLA